jgi:hypothetical protein
MSAVASTMDLKTPQPVLPEGISIMEQRLAARL